MAKPLTETLLQTYRKTHRPGIMSYVFGVPFTLAGIPFFALAATPFASGKLGTGLLFLLFGAAFILVAYLFGWGAVIRYAKTCKKIKQEQYVTVLAECKAKTICQETRFSDSGDTEDYATVTFEKEALTYTLKDWGSFPQMETGTKYLLIQWKPGSEINAVFQEDASKLLYFQ